MRGLSAVALVALVFLALILSGCARKDAAKPEDRIVTVDVPTIVREKCKDARPASPDYPDTDDKLAGVPDDDYFTLAKKFRAGRDLRDARLSIDETQIKGCSGAP